MLKLKMKDKEIFLEAISLVKWTDKKELTHIDLQIII